MAGRKAEAAKRKGKPAGKSANQLELVSVEPTQAPKRGRVAPTRAVARPASGM